MSIRDKEILELLGKCERVKKRRRHGQLNQIAWETEKHRRHCVAKRKSRISRNKKHQKREENE